MADMDRIKTGITRLAEPLTGASYRAYLQTCKDSADSWPAWVAGESETAFIHAEQRQARDYLAEHPDSKGAKMGADDWVMEEVLKMEDKKS